MPAPASGPTAWRPEIQALRAAAAGSVVLYHGWPGWVPAGYMGVDVFFVVSGFLITGILLKDVDAVGRVRFGRFYLRRARRILPGAMLVLAVTAILTLTVAPATDRPRFLWEVLASTLYVENWFLAGASQTRDAHSLDSTPVQHYWSLSLEEQFYLLHPLLIMAAVLIAARLARRYRPVLAIVIGVVAVASLVHSIVLTPVDHNLAYFSTLSRAWEFSAGALLALLPRPSGGAWRAVGSWLGLVMIALPILLWRDSHAFPGLIVLVPVIGTALVIMSGMPAERWSPAGLFALKPVQWLGDVSYPLYLWHWPVFMFTPMILGAPSPTWLMVLLVGVSILLAWATARWVEAPFRAGAFVRRREMSAEPRGGA